MLIEDLGDDLFADVLARAQTRPHFMPRRSRRWPRCMQSRRPKEMGGTPLYAYDETALLAETDLMTEWFLPVALGRTANEEEIARASRRCGGRSCGRSLSARSVFVHRDYHAQNLIWLPGRTGTARSGVIDFQDAVAGTMSYDLISLLEDARRDVSPELAGAMTRHYLDALRAGGGDLDEEALRAQMAAMAAQRNAKIAGIFARLYKRDGKPRYLDYLPRVWGYLNRDLEHPALSPLKAWYDKTIPQDVRGKPRAGAQA